MSSLQPYVIGQFVDPSYSVANTIFPSVSNYHDGRILTLILGMIFVFLIALTYMTGLCCAGVKGWDMYSTQFTVMGAVNLKGFQPTPKTSKFGGTMVIIALVTAAAVCTDVLIQYVSEYGIDRSWTTPALDVVARGTTSARIELSLDAQRDPNFPFAPCTLANLATSRAVDGQFSLTSQSSVGSSSAQFTCAYAVSCPSMTVALSPYHMTGVVPAVATLTVGLGAYLQVSSWSLKVGDAKPQAYTLGRPNTTISVNFTAGRVHNIAVIVSPSMYLDNTFLNNAAGVTTLGYRAAFAGYTVTADPMAMQGQDTLVVTWTVSPLVVNTERTLRLSILQLLGILFGLTIGTMLLFKGFYELFDGLGDCGALDYYGVRHCCSGGGRGAGGANRRSMLLSASDTLTAKDIMIDSGGGDGDGEGDGGGFGGAGLGLASEGAGGGGHQAKHVSSNPMHTAHRPVTTGGAAIGAAAVGVPATGGGQRLLPSPPATSKARVGGMFAGMRMPSMKKLVPYAAASTNARSRGGAGGPDTSGESPSGSSSPRQAGSARRLFPGGAAADASGDGGLAAEATEAASAPPPPPPPSAANPYGSSLSMFGGTAARKVAARKGASTRSASASAAAASSSAAAADDDDDGDDDPGAGAPSGAVLAAGVMSPPPREAQLPPPLAAAPVVNPLAAPSASVPLPTKVGSRLPAALPAPAKAAPAPAKQPAAAIASSEAVSTPLLAPTPAPSLPVKPQVANLKQQPSIGGGAPAPTLAAAAVKPKPTMAAPPTPIVTVVAAVAPLPTPAAATVAATTAKPTVKTPAPMSAAAAAAKPVGPGQTAKPLGPGQTAEPLGPGQTAATGGTPKASPGPAVPALKPSVSSTAAAAAAPSDSAAVPKPAIKPVPSVAAAPVTPLIAAATPKPVSSGTGSSSPKPAGPVVSAVSAPKPAGPGGGGASSAIKPGGPSIKPGGPSSPVAAVKPGSPAVSTKPGAGATESAAAKPVRS